LCCGETFNGALNPSIDHISNWIGVVAGVQGIVRDPVQAIGCGPVSRVVTR